MTDTSKPARRVRAVAALFALYTVAGIVALVALRPAPDPATFPARTSSPFEIAAAAADARESHPFGGLMVAYEHRALTRFVDRFAAGDADASADADDLLSTIHVFYIVLDEMTWLLVALFAAGLLGASLALRARPASTLVGAVLLLLVAPVPLVSVGPGAALLTAPLALGGLLILIVRPRFAPPAPQASQASQASTAAFTGASGPIAGPAETHPVRDIAVGVGLLALSVLSAVLAANIGGGGGAKLWFGAAASLGIGLYLLISGLIGLGRRPPPAPPAP